MTLLRSTVRLARDATASAHAVPQRRRQWRNMLYAGRNTYWPDIDPKAEIALEHRVRTGGGGFMLRGRVFDDRVCRVFWIKWCPQADVEALEQTAGHMRWWRTKHPNLCEPVANLLAYWPDHKALLIEGRNGVTLSRHISFCQGDPSRKSVADVAVADLDQAVTKLAGWMRAYASGHGRYETDVAPLLGSEVRRSQDGRLWVNARRLLESRVERARLAADGLVRAGLPAAGRWADRFDLDAMARALDESQPAGFIHGDLKPDNVLVDSRNFAIVDWWTAPRVSWSLQDPAALAGNLWLDDSPAAPRTWSVFADTYFSGRIDEQTQRTIDLLGVMMCLGFLERKLHHSLNKLVGRRWCGRVLERLVDHRTVLGQVQAPCLPEE